jgi:RimJ/RimL family protein N-acetyltransferase
MERANPTEAVASTLANGPWRCMPRPVLVDAELAVSAVCEAHIEDIRRWRNAQLDVLRQATRIEPDQQRTYYAQQIWPEKASACPRNILLIIREHGRAIGYGGLVHIDWAYQRAEVSFLLDPAVGSDAERHAALFVRFMRLMQTLAFGDLGLHRLTSETYAFRIAHIAILERCGFVREGVLRDHVLVDGARCDAVLHGCLARELDVL